MLAAVAATELCTGRAQRIFFIAVVFHGSQLQLESLAKYLLILFATTAAGCVVHRCLLSRQLLQGMNGARKQKEKLVALGIWRPAINDLSAQGADTFAERLLQGEKISWRK